VINEYGNRLLGLLGDRLLQNTKHGAFVDACTHHCTSCSASGEDSWNGENVKSTTEKLTPSEAFAKWYDRAIAAPASSSSSSSAATVADASNNRAVRRSTTSTSTSTNVRSDADQSKMGSNSKNKSGNREKGKRDMRERERESKNEESDEKSRSRYKRMLFDEQEAVQDGQGRIFIQSHKYPCKDCCICRP
jgi:hypothetical protein